METTTYHLKIEGVSALLMNSNSALLAGEDKGRDPAQYERDHFLDKTYRDEEGCLVIPARALKKSFIEACKFLPLKPKGVHFKSYGPFLQSATLFPEDAILDVEPVFYVYIFSRALSNLPVFLLLEYQKYKRAFRLL